jgi:hypothetical protein
VHFVTKVSLYFWNLCKILHLLIPMKSILWIQNFGPFNSAWPKKLGPMRKQSLGQTNLFCYFRYFWKVCNKSQGYFCSKCKKSPKSTHPTVHSSRKISLCFIIICYIYLRLPTQYKTYHTNCCNFLLTFFKKV